MTTWYADVTVPLRKKIVFKTSALYLIINGGGCLDGLGSCVTRADPGISLGMGAGYPGWGAHHKFSSKGDAK